MKIAIACDHGALKLKEELIPFLRKLGHSVEDFGTNSYESCDYSDFAIPAAKAVAKGRCDRGIVLCTTGIGARGSSTDRERRRAFRQRPPCSFRLARALRSWARRLHR